MSGVCPKCQDTGQIGWPSVEGIPVTHWSACDEPECVARELRRRAVALLGEPAAPDRAVFKAGELRVTMVLKGSEITDEQAEILFNGQKI